MSETHFLVPHELWRTAGKVRVGDSVEGTLGAFRKATPLKSSLLDSDLKQQSKESHERANAEILECSYARRVWTGGRGQRREGERDSVG